MAESAVLDGDSGSALEEGLALSGVPEFSTSEDAPQANSESQTQPVEDIVVICDLRYRMPEESCRA